MKNKDNPVPSLDNKETKLIIEALCAYGDDEEITNLCDKLENGVETDKEEPKELLLSLHKFNKLNKRIITEIGNIFNFDALRYCDDYGITYNRI